MNEKNKTGLIAVFRREVNWISREPSFILMTVVLPLIMFFFFVSMFREGVPRNIPIAVYDADNTHLSREISNRLHSIPALTIKYNATSLDEGKHLILQGKVYCFIYIPKDFASKVDRGVPSKVINYYNNENQLVGGTIIRDVTASIRDLSTQILKDNLTKMKLPETVVQSIAEPIAVNAHVLFNPYTNYMYYLLTGLLPTMLQFFILLCSIYTIGIEMKKGTMANAMVAGGGRVITVLTGKLLPYTIIFSIMGMFMITLMFKFLGFPLQGNILLIVAATFLFVLAYQAVALFYIGYTGKLLKAMMSASFYASTAFTFVGMTYPLVAMWWPAKVWAQLLPLTHYLNIVVEQAFRGSPVNVTAQSFFFLILFLFLPFLVMRRLKNYFTDEKHWGDWGEL